MLNTSENWTRWDVARNTKDVLFFESFDEEFWFNFQMKYWWIFWVITAFYWVTAYSLQRFMRERQPLENIRACMTTYNVLVALFSIIGLLRISTTFFPILFSQGFHTSVCERFYVTEKDGFWLLAFGWSKLFHFMDTFFTVLRKKPVQFMQLYHHSVVVLVPQHILPYGEPIIIWWGLSNLAQHALTYPYFALKSMKVKVPKFATTLIILVEVLQMLVGLGTGLYTLHVINNGGHCVRHPTSISIMYFVYVTMTILSLHLAYTHFFYKKKESIVTTTKKNPKLKSN